MNADQFGRIMGAIYGLYILVVTTFLMDIILV